MGEVPISEATGHRPPATGHRDEVANESAAIYLTVTGAV
jgi:hypothetical protein